MTKTEINQLIAWCKEKYEKEKKKPYGLSGKQLAGYRDAMFAVISHLLSLKGEK